MNAIINKITLDVAKSGSQAFIAAKYGESGVRSAVISLTKNGRVYNVEDGNTCIIRAKKPDGTIIYNSAETGDGKVIVDFSAQMCSALGKVLCEVQILDGNGNTLYAPKFYVVVEGIVYTDGTITSTDEYSQLTESILEAQSAIETAEGLHLIECVNALPVTGDDKYLYILYESENIYTLNGIPSQFSNATSYNSWKNDSNNKAVMLKTTDDTYKYLLFTGIEIKQNEYSNTGEIEIKSFAGSGDEYGYNLITKQWEHLQTLPNTLAEDDLLIITNKAPGTSYEPFEDDYVVDETSTLSYTVTSGVMWLHGTYTLTRRMTSNDYTDSDNKFEIYNGYEIALPYGCPYVWNDDFDVYINVNDASIYERLDAAEDNISDLQEGKQDKLTAGDNVTIDENNVISAVDTTYTAGNGIKIDSSNKIISTGTVTFGGQGDISPMALTTYTPAQFKTEYGITIDDLISLVSRNALIEVIYNNLSTVEKFRLVANTEYSSNTIGDTDTTIIVLTFEYNTKTFSMQIFDSVSESTEEVSVKIIEDFEIQKKLTAGNNVLINSGNVISATDTTYTADDGIEINNNKISTKDIFEITYTKGSNNVWTCDKSGSEIIDAYNKNKNFIFYANFGNNVSSVFSCSGHYYITTVTNGDILYANLCTDNSPVQKISVDIQHRIPNSSSGYLETIEVNTGTVNLQPKLSQGSNITISGNTISATDTTYSAGNGININGNNVISLKAKSNGGIAVDSNGVYVDKNNTLEIDTNNKLGVSEKIQDTIAANTMIGKSSGAVASFTDGGADMPMKSCIVGIEPVQSGSGDPSPSNVRAISGWSECNIIVKDDLSNPTVTNTYKVEFIDNGNPLTVYGGTVDVVSGVLTVDRVMVDLGDYSWGKISGQNKFYVIVSDSVKFHTLGGTDRNVPENFVCSAYKLVGGQDAYDCVYDFAIGGSYFNSANYILVNDSNYSTAEDFKEGVEGVKLVYELAAPQTYQLTPTEVKTLLGSNNIFADTGDIEECEYTRDATTIINELIARIEELES